MKTLLNDKSKMLVKCITLNIPKQKFKSKKQTLYNSEFDFGIDL